MSNDKATNVPVKVERNFNWEDFDTSEDYPMLSDVYGTKEFKDKLENIIAGVGNEMLFGCFGVTPPRSFLFQGPPGTGKSFSARAIYNEVSAKLDPQLAVMLEYAIGTYGTAYINMGSKNLQTYFNTGLALLREPDSPVSSVLYYFDEAEVVLGKRGGSQSHKEDDKLLNTLMKNLQEIHDRGDSEYIIFATNFPELMDEAALRSGRVDGVIDFPLPTPEARKVAFEGYIAKANKRAGYGLIRKYNTDNLVEMSEGFNYADIDAVVNGAIHAKLNKELRRKPKGVIPAYWIGQNYLEDSLNQVKAKKNPTKKRIGFI